MKSTPFLSRHQAAGARIVDFAGWSMPVQYAGLVEEHLTVRRAAGLFDVSHMGEIEVRGPDALAYLQNLVTNDVAKCEVGQAQYNAMCLPTGGIVDDLVIYRRGIDNFLVCVNASNTDKDFAWARSQMGALDVSVENTSDRWAQLALQGPNAEKILQSLADWPLPNQSYRFEEGQLLDIDMIVARTGYTGEYGYEIFFSPEHAEFVWDNLMEVGSFHGMAPIGLGARDTLRLEMKYALYGNDIDETTHPLEAGLGWITKLGKGDFNGRAAMMAAKEKGLTRKLVGFKLLDRGVPRHGYPILNDGGEEIGVVTSGTHSPSLGIPIGMAYLPVALAAPGSTFFVQIRKNRLAAQVVETPFYHPAHKA